MSQIQLTNGEYAERVIAVGLDGVPPAAEASGATAGKQDTQITAEQAIQAGS